MSPKKQVRLGAGLACSEFSFTVTLQKFYLLPVESPTNDLTLVQWPVQCPSSLPALPGGPLSSTKASFIGLQIS